MTPAEEVIAKLFLAVDTERIQKAKGMAARLKVAWTDVLAAMTDEQRKQVSDAS